MKKLYFLLLSVGILTACDKEKDGPELDYPVTFASKELYNTTPVRMYTKRGEVKDAALINAFATKYNSGYHLEDHKIEATTDEKIALVSRSEAELRNGSNTRKYDAAWSGEVLTITSKEEGTVLYNQSDEYYLSVAAGISKYKPIIYDKQTVSASSGVSYKYKTKAQLFATLKGNELQVHRMTYTLKSGNENAYVVRSNNTSNQFDESGISLLRDTDTLLVQEFVAIGLKE